MSGPEMQAAELEARLAAFGAAKGLFDALVDELGDPAADELTHAELEERIATRGREVMRQMLQDHLDLRSIREPRRSEVTGADRVVRRRVEPGHERRLATVFGTVTVTRIAYRALRASNLHPMDARLNLPLERASFGLRRLAAIEAVRGSFDDAKSAIERITGTRIGKRQIEQLAEHAACDIEAYYRARCRARVRMRLCWSPRSTARASSCVPSTCAKPPRRPPPSRAATPCEVYDAEPAPRTAADVIRPPARTGSARPGRGRRASG